MEHNSRVPIVVAIISAVSAIAVAIIAVAWPSGDSPEVSAGATPTTTPSATEEPSDTGGPTRVEYGERRTYQLTLTAGVYVDLDTETAELDGGTDFEFFYKGDINRALFFGKDPMLYGRSEVALTSYEDANPEACDKSTRPQDRSVSGYLLEDDDVICMITSEGALAILDVLEWGGTGGKDAVIDVTYWPTKPAK